MRLKTTLLFILACFLQSPFAQITVLGKLAIGDTSHFHILRTTRNDQFIGKVMSWSTDSLIFETTSKARIAFPVSVVKSIEASETQQASSIGTDIFILRTTDGGIYYGFPTSISEKKITFEANKAGILKLGPEEVISMEAETAFLVTKAPYINEYQLKDNDWNKTDGELIAYREGHIFHQDAKGMVWRVPVEGVKKYELKPQYQPFTGHGRSLMFVPTGFRMAPFETEYRNIALGINIFAFGITEHLSAGVGLGSPSNLRRTATHLPRPPSIARSAGSCSATPRRDGASAAGGNPLRGPASTLSRLSLFLTPRHCRSPVDRTLRRQGAPARLARGDGSLVRILSPPHSST